MSGLREIDAADEYCAFLTARHYENFVVASPFVESGIRRDLRRVYAYCRTTDDLGDESGADALARLERWRDEVSALFAGAAPVHPVLVALRDTIERRAIPSQPFFGLIEANVQDQRTHSYEDWDALAEYCTRSAAPVGRMVLHVFGIASETTYALSDDVCIGLQLANFAQDVSVDRAKGRTYLLQSELREGGAVTATRRHVERARNLLRSGERLESLAPPALRRQLALYRRGGLAICAAIERCGFATEAQRPRVATATKLGLLVRAL